MDGIINACITVIKSLSPQEGFPVLSEKELERFAREFALSYYIEPDNEEGITVSDRLDSLEHIATYGNDIIPMDWLAVSEEEMDDLLENSIKASEMLLVADECAESLVRFVQSLSEYVKGK